MSDQTQLLKDSFRRHMVDEFLPRIERCIDLLTIEEIWEQQRDVLKRFPRGQEGLIVRVLIAPSGRGQSTSMRSK